MKKTIRKLQLRVFSLNAAATRGWLTYGALRWPCALGRTGRRAIKREGDGATPIGSFRLLKAYYRPDRLMRPRVPMPLTRLRSSDGWCDAVGDRNYNRYVAHPYAASAERMWRADGLYDVVVVLDYNVKPRAQGRGSAIFMHCAREGFAPTEGCIALQRRDLLQVLGRMRRDTRVTTSSDA